jgi:hypothetical protein
MPTACGAIVLSKVALLHLWMRVVSAPFDPSLLIPGCFYRNMKSRVCITSLMQRDEEDKEQQETRKKFICASGTGVYLSEHADSHSCLWYPLSNAYLINKVTNTSFTDILRLTNTYDLLVQPTQCMCYDMSLGLYVSTSCKPQQCTWLPGNAPWSPLFCLPQQQSVCACRRSTPPTDGTQPATGLCTCGPRRTLRMRGVSCKGDPHQQCNRCRADVQPAPIVHLRGVLISVNYQHHHLPPLHVRTSLKLVVHCRDGTTYLCQGIFKGILVKETAKDFWFNAFRGMCDSFTEEDAVNGLLRNSVRALCVMRTFQVDTLCSNVRCPRVKRRPARARRDWPWLSVVITSGTLCVIHAMRGTATRGPTPSSSTNLGCPWR